MQILKTGYLLFSLNRSIRVYEKACNLKCNKLTVPISIENSRVYVLGLQITPLSMIGNTKVTQKRQ